MFGMFKKKEPPRELTPEEIEAKRRYNRTWHGSDANLVAASLPYGANLDKTFRTFGPELSAKIDSIPDVVNAIRLEALYDECSEHCNALQRRYNKLQDEYVALAKENGQLKERLTKYEH